MTRASTAGRSRDRGLALSAAAVATLCLFGNDAFATQYIGWKSGSTSSGCHFSDINAAIADAGLNGKFSGHIYLGPAGSPYHGTNVTITGNWTVEQGGNTGCNASSTSGTVDINSNNNARTFHVTSTGVLQVQNVNVAGGNLEGGAGGDGGAFLVDSGGVLELDEVEAEAGNCEDGADNDCHTLVDGDDPDCQ